MIPVNLEVLVVEEAAKDILRALLLQTRLHWNKILALPFLQNYCLWPLIRLDSIWNTSIPVDEVLWLIDQDKVVLFLLHNGLNKVFIAVL